MHNDNQLHIVCHYQALLAWKDIYIYIIFWSLKYTVKVCHLEPVSSNLIWKVEYVSFYLLPKPTKTVFKK